MSNGQVHLAGIGSVPPDQLKTVLAAFSPSWTPLPSPQEQARWLVRECGFRL